jgi:predicted PurR-regulated permease PerM
MAAARELPARDTRPLDVSIARPSARGVAKVIAVVALGAAAGYLLYLTRDVIKIVAIAAFTAIALGPLVDLVQRSGLARAWSIAAVYVALVLLVLGAGAAIVPSIGSQVQTLSTDGARSLSNLRRNPTVRRYDEKYHVTSKLQEQVKRLPQRATQLSKPLRDVTVGVFGFFSSLVAVLSIAFLLLLSGRSYANQAFDLLPPAHAERCRRLAPQVYSAVSHYVLGNLAISAIAGAGAWAVMVALGLPFALPLALLVAFLDLIPMIGATLAAAAVALVALLVSPLAALIWIVYALLYQQVENYVIQPVVYRRTVEVNALTTIIAVMAGGALLGLLGALLAIPVAAAMQLVIRDFRRPTGPVAPT